jgi:hypothetical protein
MEDNWVSVFRTNDFSRAELAKERLANEGIEAVVMNKKDSFLLMGELDVFVKSEYNDQAKNLLKVFTSE